MAPKSTIASLLAASTLAAANPEKQGTEELILPPINGKPSENLMATVLAEDDDSSVAYLVACESSFSKPENCEGPWDGVVVTQTSDNSLVTKLDGKEYECHWDDEAVLCNIDGKQQGFEGEEADDWHVDVTIVDQPDDLELRSIALAKRKSYSKGSSSKGSAAKNGFKAGKNANKDNDTDDENVAPGTGKNALPSTIAVVVAALGFAIAM